MSIAEGEQPNAFGPRLCQVLSPLWFAPSDRTTDSMYTIRLSHPVASAPGERPQLLPRPRCRGVGGRESICTFAQYQGALRKKPWRARAGVGIPDVGGENGNLVAYRKGSREPPACGRGILAPVVRVLPLPGLRMTLNTRAVNFQQSPHFASLRQLAELAPPARQHSSALSVPTVPIRWK